MNFLNTIQNNTTREQRVELMMAMLMKTDKVTWEKVQYRFQDAFEVHLKLVIIVAALIATVLIANPHMISTALDLLRIISGVAVTTYLITVLRKQHPEFGLATLLIGLTMIAVIFTVAMLFLSHPPILIAIAGISGTSLAMSIGLHWLAHLLWINFAEVHFH
jgi:hypothetical protein